MGKNGKMNVWRIFKKFKGIFFPDIAEYFN